MLLLGLACLVIGYAVRVPPVNLRRLPILHRQRWSMKRFAVVAIVLGGIAIVSTALYIEKMGIVFTTLDTISSKRKYELANASFGHASLGYYVWGASLFTPLLYLYTAWFAEAGKRLVSMAGLVLVVLALGAALVPFIKSSRTGVLIVFVHVAVIWHYLRGPIRLRSLALAGAALLAIFLVLTALRARAQDTDELAAYVGVEAVMSELVGSRNLFGIAKSGLIAHHVPETIDYKYGSTFVVWIYTPVPRTLWKNKPVIHVGNEIGDKIYSNPEGSGVPPGFFGEAYLNFGWIGVPFAFFVLGVLMRLIYASFWPYRSNKNAVVVYATVATAVAYSAVGGDVAGAVIGIATSLIPLLVAIAFVGRRAQPLAPA